MIERELFDDLILGHQEKKHHLFHVLKDLGFKPHFNQVGNLYCQADIISAMYFIRRIQLLIGIHSFMITDYDGKDCRMEFTNNIPWIDPSFIESREPLAGIYLITNKINCKQYVGQSQNIYRRWIHHKHSVDWKYHNKHTLIVKALKKYGIENFTFEIIDVVPDSSRDKLNELEIEYIQKFHTYVDDPLAKYPGYNLTTGGNEKRIVSEATRLKQRLAKLGKPSIRRGHKLSDESREKMRIAAKTRPRNSGYTLSSKAIINNKVSHLKGTLYRHPDRCIQVSLDNKTLWFVNEGEASRFYIGTNKAIRILQNKMENHFFIPVSVKQENSKGWQTLKNATVSSCSLEELLEHRPELRH